MAVKFQRNYSLSLEVAGGQNVTIELPYRCEFEIVRDTLASSQTATFRIYNMKQSIRDLIWKDQYLWTQFRAIKFSAGYGSFTPVIFNGSIKQAYSEHGSGAQDGVTTIEAYDGAYQITNGLTNMTLAAGQPADQVIKTLAASLPNITGQPIVGSFPTTNLRGEVLFGNTWDMILKKSGGLGTIDNGQPKILNLNDVVTGSIPLIDASTGLLGAPKRTNAMVTFEMLFEPRITIGQALALKSSYNALLNGNYKVMGFTHRGRITDLGDPGEARTSVNLWLGTAALNPIAATVQ